ncbi:PTS transporter subunit EIIC [Lactobacillus sp. LL6]|uniref:PTS transporter subunit EIIC n=1 Tax=Lactobacillus sp. LL6 TaxID=2596827 RepID=UPI0011871005|nr:PTS transporter subunit EIIC [Lactobacillus sp. LL6]TSO26399.1 PTS sugar transporter subunit IIC [Lactobacillus sp. LL6]
MNKKVVDLLTRFENSQFIKVLNWSMMVLFPVALLGSFAWILNMVILNPNGFIGNMININHWLDNLWFIRTVIGDIERATMRLLALYAAVISASVSAKIYRSPSLLAEVIAVVSYVLIFFHTVRNRRMIVDTSYYTSNWFIIGILVGYVTGLIFAKLGKANLSERSDILENWKPFSLMIGLAFILHILYAIFRTYSLDTVFFEGATAFSNRHSNYWLSLIISIISTFSLWIGYAGTLNFSTNIFSNESLANLNYVLNHKSGQVPYPFTPNSLNNGFAQVGGSGILLGLIIAILLISTNKRTIKVANWSIMPVFFGANMPLILGLPLILNPIYFIPFLLTPIINLTISGILMALKLIPVIVYPVLEGTPGILVPFVGSGGNITMLVYSLFLLILDILIYLPFVKLANQVAKINKEVTDDERK